MSYDDDWPDQTLENRKLMIRKTIRRAEISDLRALGDKYFKVVTDPWCEHYNKFLQEHAAARYYQAETPEGAEIAYCRDTEQGVWFLPDSGMGVIQPRGLGFLKEIVDSL